MENLSVFDPFALLNLEKKYELKDEALEKAYFEAQKKAHPDKFVQASYADRQEASQLSTSINQAYQILKDPLQRADYLLKEIASFPEPAFLEQVILWKEKLAQGVSLTEELSKIQQTLFKKLETAFENKNYGEAKTALYKLHYIQKIA